MVFRIHFSFFVLIFSCSLSIGQNLKTFKPYKFNLNYNYLNQTPFNGGFYKSGLKKITFKPNGEKKPTKVVKLDKGYMGSRLVPFNGGLVHIYLPDVRLSLNAKGCDEQILWLTERDLDLNEINSFKFSEIKQKIGSIPFANYLIKSDQDSFLLAFSEKVSIYPETHIQLGTNAQLKKLDESREIAFFTLFDHKLKTLTTGKYDFGIKKGYVRKRFHHLFNDGDFMMGINHSQVNSSLADGWKIALMDKESNVSEILVSLNEYNMLESNIQFNDSMIYLTGLAGDMENLKKPIGTFKIEIYRKSMEIKNKIVVKFKEQLINDLYQDITSKYLYYEGSSIRANDGYCYYTIRKISYADNGSIVLGKQFILSLNNNNQLSYNTHGGGMALIARTMNTNLAFIHDDKACLLFSSFGRYGHPHYDQMKSAKNWEKAIRKMVKNPEDGKVYYMEMSAGSIDKEGFVVNEKNDALKGAWKCMIDDNVHPGKFLVLYEGRMLKIGL
tara:strand:+ start:13664 stop:15160 length:1497 start_codon:yes stop_codon:yes gene_type:complete